MWIWRRLKRVKWTDRIRNEAVLERVGEERMMLKLIRKRKRNWLCHWLRRNCILKDVLEECLGSKTDNCGWQIADVTCIGGGTILSYTINRCSQMCIVLKDTCQKRWLSSTQKFLVQQHITTSKHQANKQLNSKQRQLFLTQPTTSNEFLEKYTQHTIPDESTLRKTYAPSIYDETIQKIRDEIKDSSIWVSIDETPDKEGRLVGNVVIGLLSEQYSERILLHCDVLEKCNNKTIVKLFNEAMGILWPKGIMYDNVLFFISDAAPYMVKAGQALSVVYPKLTHFTCVAHAFHRVAEVVRDNFLK
ncbi:hypothetical protein ANN_14452 [Periplaneta americana]|uniref:DUF659 domain-containing protein n=1 Tax=Periplaneta americana TaxID=6978 RepID=A0ABQ8SWC4_PERAM|nr:hypothetical protein ANN_14452 [Periplaneta americana]